MESKVLKERSKWLTLFTRSLEEVNGWLEEMRRVFLFEWRREMVTSQ